MPIPNAPTHTDADLRYQRRLAALSQIVGGLTVMVCTCAAVLWLPLFGLIAMCSDSGTTATCGDAYSGWFIGAVGLVGSLVAGVLMLNGDLDERGTARRRRGSILLGAGFVICVVGLSQLFAS